MASTEAGAAMAAALPFELSRLFQAPEGPPRDDAWADFVAAHSRLLLHVARSLSPDHDTAMDGYAYVLERLREDHCRRLRGYVADGRSKFTTWLVVVARRLCLDCHRHRYGRARDSTPDTAAEQAARRRLADLVAGAADPDQLAAPAADPALSTQVRELHETLAAATARLAPPDRLLLKLRFDDDLSAREIAAVVGLPTPFHVYRRINALLELLRGSLRQRGVEGAEP
jgi:RNA polymerase sigma factor (sigma-70 family)